MLARIMSVPNLKLSRTYENSCGNPENVQTKTIPIFTTQIILREKYEVLLVDGS